MTERWVVTGANGNLGRKLIGDLKAADREVVALVRSERARELVRNEAGGSTTVEIVDYTDVQALQRALAGADRVVHLVGIIKEGAGATYEEAHEKSCTALVQALRENPRAHITYLSIVGALPSATNACLASKGRAEEILRAGDNPVCVLRVPMVLGENDYVSLGLRQRVLKGRAIGFRMSSLEQPIYSGDVNKAIQQAAKHIVNGGFDLGGPEVLTRAALSQRAGAIFDREVAITSLPLALGKVMAGIFSTFMSNPPITPAMLEILDHDDQVNNEPALQALDLNQLTPLDDMLKATIACPELA